VNLIRLPNVAHFTIVSKTTMMYVVTENVDYILGNTLLILISRDAAFCNESLSDWLSLLASSQKDRERERESFLLLCTCGNLSTSFLLLSLLLSAHTFYEFSFNNCKKIASIQIMKKMAWRQESERNLNKHQSLKCAKNESDYIA
jgi:hypothetical protein